MDLSMSGARASLSWITILGLFFSLMVAAPSQAAVKSGATCKKAGLTAKKSGAEFECRAKSGRLVWVKKKSSGVRVPVVVPTTSPSPSPAPTASPTPTVLPSATPTPTASPSASPTFLSTRSKPMPAPTPGISIYRGGAGNSARPKEKSFELPVSVTAPPSGSNVKLWVYDPENKSRALGSGGIFFQKDSGAWTFLNGNSDGSIYANWSPGSYSIDTVEPGGRATEYSRKRYLATVSSSGEFSVSGMDANSQGYFTLTITKVAAKQVYSPTSACRLEDQTGNIRMAVGFPKREYRLPSEGRINALIIPVDFSDVPGRGDPEELFRVMTDESARFFYSQSDGRVQFNFQSLDTWLRAPFKSDAYRLGTYNQGDAGGYFSAVLALADPLVDYSLFDVVYVLSPKETPASSIAYGPAFPNMPGDDSMMTNEGLVRNGTISGADAWQTLPGAGWKWLSHETGHLFGIHDLYTISKPGTYGSWDLMSLNWSTAAIAINAWNRYIQGWLAESQVRCIEVKDLSAPKETLITPIERESDGIKAVMVPLSSKKMLVMESRRSEGYDVLSDAQAGLLVYTVDMTIQSIEGGWNTQRRPGSTNSDFTDAALKAGDKITVDGIQIEVISRDASGDRVRLTRG
jgi:M6 family metalloprotease-like protein